jgi:G3E family GTPase
VLQSDNKKVGVITNDQGIILVDTGYFQSNAIPNRQVINGCFCCNYDSLDENIESLIKTNDPDVIFAESVGSCTDIVATVMKPLQQFKKDIAVTVSTFADARLLHMLFIENKQLFNDEVKLYL